MLSMRPPSDQVRPRGRDTRARDRPHDATERGATPTGERDSASWAYEPVGEEHDKVLTAVARAHVIAERLADGDIAGHELIAEERAGRRATFAVIPGSSSAVTTGA